MIATAEVGRSRETDRGTPDRLCVNTIRMLSMDAVQAANSGHPGAPMRLAPVVYCLWQKYLPFDPTDLIWPNRDRFILSAGHASMLLYSLLHLTGVKAVSKNYETLGEPSVPLDAINHFRQLDSRCPGHPEYRWSSGVETTTGPLGQGLANSIGMRSFGASAPPKDLVKKFGFTADQVVAAARSQLDSTRTGFKHPSGGRR